MDILNALRSITGPDHVLIGPDTAGFATEWIGKYQNTPLAIVRPGSVEEVSQVMRLANETRTPVVPVSGHTGLSGGAHAPKDLLGPSPRTHLGVCGGRRVGGCARQRQNTSAPPSKSGQVTHRFHIRAILSRALDVLRPLCRRDLRRLRKVNLPLVDQVALGANQHDHDIIQLRLDLFQPALRPSE